MNSNVIRKKKDVLLKTILCGSLFGAPAAMVLSVHNTALAQEANQWQPWQRMAGYPNLEYRYKPNGDPTSRVNIADMEFRGPANMCYHVLIVSTDLNNDGTLNKNYSESIKAVSTNGQRKATATAHYPVVVEVHSHGVS